MVAPDHHRRRDAAGADELVDGLPCARPVSVAEPADAGREPLESHPTWGQLEPAVEQPILREEPQELAVDLRNVVRVAREGCPSERTDPATEKRPDIGRDEARVCKGLVYARLIRLPSEVVAIIENVAPCPDELEEAEDVL